MLFLLSAVSVHGYSINNSREYLTRGWDELIKDNDVLALENFSIAYTIARENHDILNTADALFHMGICTYGSSYNNGMKYAILSIEEYSKLEKYDPVSAMAGKSKCLQLISTIYSRQGKYNEAILLSRKAMTGIDKETDTTGTYGLIYSSLGSNYAKLGMLDSARHYHQLALDQHLRTKNRVYLPVAYIKCGNIEMLGGKKDLSFNYYRLAMEISDSTENLQAKVSSLLALGKWYLVFEENIQMSESLYLEAKKISEELSDKLFMIQTIQHLIELEKGRRNFTKALVYAELLQATKDSLSNLEKERLIESLEAQFLILEKDKQLAIVQKDQKINHLIQYALWIGIVLLVFISVGIFLFMKRINKRDQQLLQQKESIQKILIEQQVLKDRQMRNEIDFKESQLSALTLQMLQKNELLQELLEKAQTKDPDLTRIVNKGFNQDKEWDDFNLHFESINKNFYTRLRESFPGISPNDLKICALIKLNLSTKEMASILNISPDSVKTARYRLRKKLNLNTEDNLTGFIQSLS